VKLRLSVCWYSVLVLGALPVRAGLFAATGDAQPQRTGQATAFAEPVSACDEALSVLPSQRLLTSLALGDPVDPASFAVESGQDDSQLTTLPPAPDSAVLALSGLLGLGAVQLGRNVRKLHFGALPEWYHEGAVQIGHSTPLDLDLGFTHAALPACAFTQPTERVSVLFGAQWPDAVPCAPQFQPTPESPRAPPQTS
jgi:hypothetical protein